MSSISVTNFAPLFKSLFVPTPFSSPILCGMQNIFLSKLLANSAVIPVPLFCFASITKVPTDKPATILFLSLNPCGKTSTSLLYSVITAPSLSNIFSNLKKFANSLYFFRMEFFSFVCYTQNKVAYKNTLLCLLLYKKM